MKFSIRTSYLFIVCSLLIASVSHAWDSTKILHYAARSWIGVDVLKEDIVENFDLKKFMKKYDITLDEFRGEYPWEYVTWDIINNPERRSKLVLKSSYLPKLIKDAKDIIRSFLLTDESRLESIEKEWVKKSGLNRLFTYAKFQRVIEEKKLSHIKLPKKVLVIKRGEEYVPIKSAPGIIDNILKIIAKFSNELNVSVGYLGKEYDLIIFAEKIKNTSSKFKKDVCEELIALIEEAPFDVSYDNIFSDKNGDAVIIDTEYKGESADSSAMKLKARYCVNY